MTTAEIQQALNAAGANPQLAVDGKNGPATQKAVRDYQAAHGLGVDGVAGPKTQAALQGAAAPATGSADQATKDKYPQFAWLYNDPELGPLLRQAADAGWSDTQLEGAVQQTNWWKAHGAASRSFLQLAATDPAETASRLDAFGSAAKFLAKNASYGLPMTMDWALQQVQRVVRGELSADHLDETVLAQAKAMYPQFAAQFDQGQTAEDIFEPFRQIAAQTLNVNPSTILITDPKWQSLLTVDDGKGSKRLATVDEAQNLIRTDGRFGFNASQSGRNFYNDAAQVVGKAFGSVA